MKITIIGGGKLGYLLVEKLDPMPKTEIVLIEKDKIKAKRISCELEIPVINLDASDPVSLVNAGVEDTDIFMVVTGSDEINFVCAEVIRKLFDYKKLIARVNNPKNRVIFESIGAELIVSSTEIMAQIIEKDVKDIFNRRDNVDE